VLLADSAQKLHKVMTEVNFGKGQRKKKESSSTAEVNKM